MNAKLLGICFVGVTLLTIGFTAQSILSATGIELWYQHHSYLIGKDDVQKSKALIDKAAQAGYTGVLFGIAVLA